eukprot:TRINITY_DN11644_c0_g1_i1.p1 TRINITY_DN11644_c0_g1~~TRINITY_DN11644_c0_g1_i1.p1  ORF type:complete len:127 (-),score=7.22 TRINITY_DN11644_c0_g1_i1:110-490(-)
MKVSTRINTWYHLLLKLQELPPNKRKTVIPGGTWDTILPLLFFQWPAPAEATAQTLPSTSHTNNLSTACYTRKPKHCTFKQFDLFDPSSVHLPVTCKAFALSNSRGKRVKLPRQPIWQILLPATMS